MSYLFSFEGRMKRLPYSLWSLGLFFSQHLLVLILFAAYGVKTPSGWDAAPIALEFAVAPLRLIVLHWKFSEEIVFAALFFQLLVAWALAALAFRRALDAGDSGWIAALAIAPIAQIAIIVRLSSLPTLEQPIAPVPKAEGGIGWPIAVKGVLAGIALIVAGVATGTFIFRAYGYGVFVIAPLVMGACTAAIANWRQDIGRAYTTRLVMCAMTLGGIAIVLTAVEGLICILMAAPLGYGMAYLGGLLGRAIALYSRRSARHTLSGFSVLPLILIAEVLLTPMTSFQTENRITIDASPAVVWESIVNMERIEEPLPLIYRLGVAYPVQGQVIGEGVGAVRIGIFSTGTALERVTSWEPGRKLGFRVFRNIPAMTELSPYEHLQTPHLTSYFSTHETHFELQPMADGGTELIERTSHVLKLEPVLYWLPLARLVVAQNNARILGHIKRQAEAK